MRVLACPASLKGVLTAVEAAAALGRGARRVAGIEVVESPVADGGEGTLEVLLTALGGETAGARVHDPLGREVAAGFGLVEDGGTAVVEMAAASGLGLVAPEDRDAWAASTRGTGELICAAADAGAAVVLVAVGGSATTDGGLGAVEAIEEHGGLSGTRIVVLCDVRTPWERAPAVFGPQKGADPAMVVRLEARLDALADRWAREHGRDPRGVSMTGAAGGLSGGLWAACGAALEPGAPFVLGALDFDARMRASRCVVTGEGKLDEQSLEGKITGEIGTRTRQAGVPLHAIVGVNALDPFGARMVDLQVVQEATTLAEVEAAGEHLAGLLRAGRA
jgi:glycerate kinase